MNGTLVLETGTGECQNLRYLSGSEELWEKGLDISHLITEGLSVPSISLEPIS